MFNFSYAPTLAAGIGDLIWVVVVIVSVITWIIRTVQGTNQQLPPPVQRPGRRREERDDEIDSFLEQVNRTQPPNRPARPAESRNQAPATRSKSATVPPTPAKQRQPARQLSEPLQSSQSARLASDQNAARRTNVTTQDLGTGMQQHLNEYMGERVAKEARRDMGPGLLQPAQPKSGGQSAGLSKPSNSRSDQGTPILASMPNPEDADSNSAKAARAQVRTDLLLHALRNPQMIKQSIVVQEILGRPKSLRK